MCHSNTVSFLYLLRILTATARAGCASRANARAKSLPAASAGTTSTARRESATPISNATSKDPSRGRASFIVGCLPQLPISGLFVPHHSCVGLHDICMNYLSAFIFYLDHRFARWLRRYMLLLSLCACILVYYGARFILLLRKALVDFYTLIT